MSIQNSDNLGNINSRLKKIITSRITSSINKVEPKLLYDPAAYILNTGGKRARGILVVLLSELFGTKASKAYSAAAAIEILHLFTLVHDDIMDKASKRRGFDTIHNKWDEGTAILTGDYLVGLAYYVLLMSKASRIDEIVKAFTNAIIEVCEGQAFDKEFEEREDVRLNEYYTMIEKKTGKLFESSALIGGLLGDASDEEIKLIKRFGYYIGRAFQIKDDLLDIYGNEKEIGKDMFSDIKSSKKTYFYSNSLQVFSGKDYNILKKIYRQKQKSSDSIKEAVGLYEKYGLIDKANFEVERLLKKAKNILDKFLPRDISALKNYVEMMKIRRF